MAHISETGGISPADSDSDTTEDPLGGLMVVPQAFRRPLAYSDFHQSSRLGWSPW